MSEDMTTDFTTESMPSAPRQLDQVSQADSLIDRGLEDILDEGWVAPDNWSPAQGFGNTPAEMRKGETIEMRVAQELPERAPRIKGPWNPDGEQREVGVQRAGRLVAPGGSGPDDEAQSIAADVGIAGGAASAEEAAMHIIDIDSELAAAALEDPEDDDDL